MMTIREQAEQREKQILSPYASFSCDKKGRDKEPGWPLPAVYWGKIRLFSHNGSV